MAAKCTTFHFEDVYTLEEVASRLAEFFNVSEPHLLSELQTIFDGGNNSSYPFFQPMLDLLIVDVPSN